MEINCFSDKPNAALSLFHMFYFKNVSDVCCRMRSFGIGRERRGKANLEDVCGDKLGSQTAYDGPAEYVNHGLYLSSVLRKKSFFVVQFYKVNGRQRNKTFVYAKRFKYMCRGLYIDRFARRI